MINKLTYKCKLRFGYISLAILTIVFGLSTRIVNHDFPEFVTLYVGDILWALMVFWLTRAAQPNLKLVQSALIAIAFAFVIELSQLYQAEWINNIRATTLGGLVLGFGFKVTDLVCYTLGVAIGFWLDLKQLKRSVEDK